VKCLKTQQTEQPNRHNWDKQTGFKTVNKVYTTSSGVYNVPGNNGDPGDEIYYLYPRLRL